MMESLPIYPYATILVLIVADGHTSGFRAYYMKSSNKIAHIEIRIVFTFKLKNSNSGECSI